MRAIRPRVCSVHIQSLNHNPRSGETLFQTDSEGNNVEPAKQDHSLTSLLPRAAPGEKLNWQQMITMPVMGPEPRFRDELI
jgi:hypothetical protein